MSSDSRMNKAKLANGRKRIRVVSDSSADEQETEQSKNIQNGSAATSLSVGEKEARFRQLQGKIELDEMLLRDVLNQNNWDVNVAYDFLMGNSNHKNSSITYENSTSYSNGTIESSHKSKTKKVISMIMLKFG